jgi:hypothetical protein
MLQINFHRAPALAAAIIIFVCSFTKRTEPPSIRGTKACHFDIPRKRLVLGGYGRLSKIPLGPCADALFGRKKQHRLAK